MRPELRVLSGLHQGASCPVQDGYVIGRDTACDIVLSDGGLPARAAALHLGEAGWSMRTVPDDGSQGVQASLDDRGDDLGSAFGARGPEASNPESIAEHRWNDPYRLADVWITIAAADSEWIRAPDGMRPHGGSGADSRSNAASAMLDADAVQGEKRLPFAPPKANRWLTRGLLVLMVFAILATIAVLLPGGTAVTPAKPPAHATAPDQTLGAITTAIDQLGLASRLHVSVQPDGGLVVRGWVVDQAEENRLAQALSQVWPMPAMRVSLQSVAMRAAVKALAPHKIRFLPVYLGEGRMIIHGVAIDARERAAALDAVRAELPGMTVMGDDILLSTQVEQTLTARLRAAGLDGLMLSWDENGLRVADPGLSDAQLARLDTLLAAFNKEFFNIATVRNAGAPGSTASDRVPFEIRSVMGGPQPFVVLDNGMNLVPGGSYRGYRLVAIEPRQLIFDGVQKAIVLR